MSGQRAYAGDVSLSVEETNVLRAKLGLRPLRCARESENAGGPSVTGPQPQHGQLPPSMPSTLNASKPNSKDAEFGSSRSSNIKLDKDLKASADDIDRRAEEYLDANLGEKSNNLNEQAKSTEQNIQNSKKNQLLGAKGMEENSKENSFLEDEIDAQLWVEGMRKNRVRRIEKEVDSTSRILEAQHGSCIEPSGKNVLSVENAHALGSSSQTGGAVLTFADRSVVDGDSDDEEDDMLVDEFGNEIGSRSGSTGRDKVEGIDNVSENARNLSSCNRDHRSEDLSRGLEETCHADGTAKMLKHFKSTSNLPYRSNLSEPRNEVKVSHDGARQTQLLHGVDAAESPGLNVSETTDDKGFGFRRKASSRKKRKRKSAENALDPLLPALPSTSENQSRTQGLALRDSTKDCQHDSRNYRLASTSWLTKMRNNAELDARNASRTMEESEDEDDEFQQTVDEARRKALRSAFGKGTGEHIPRLFQYTQSKQDSGSSDMQTKGDNSESNDSPPLIVTEADKIISDIGTELASSKLGTKSSGASKITRLDGNSENGSNLDHLRSPMEDFQLTEDAQASRARSEQANVELDERTGHTADEQGSVSLTTEISNPLGTAQYLSRLRELGELKRPRLQQGRARDLKYSAEIDGDRVKLFYRDAQGRDLTPKEAFRLLSHRFHGKGPGQNKREARMRREQQQNKLQGAITSEDTPLASVAAFRDETRKRGAPHVVLSGSSALQQEPATTEQSYRAGNKTEKSGSDRISSETKPAEGVDSRSERNNEDVVQFSLDVTGSNAGKRVRRA